MGIALAFSGPFSESEIVEAIEKIRRITLSQGVTYDMVTIKVDPSKVVVVDWQNGGFATDGIEKSIELPTLQEFIDIPSSNDLYNWAQLLKLVSTAIQDVLISMFVGYSMEVALNGQILGNKVEDFNNEDNAT
ncbi:hypothetical protein HYS03_02725 [Candidatus Woesebacteria bacterium]|nr:hypothetical protein [Candidatus Woesebacteria bacterium]QQG47245.1 MAG: hypothetical protein HY044_03920 [Candidatus Woesebacteria bacterium]